MAEQLFTAVVETADGKTETRQVRGNSPGEVFQMVKAMPGVRRVGKIRAGDSPVMLDVGKPKPKGSHAPAPSRPPAQCAAPAPRQHLSELNRPLSGPRVVIAPRVSAWEQPFRRPKPPSPRPASPPKPQPVAQPVAPLKPEPPKTVAPRPAPAAPAIATPAVAAEVKEARREPSSTGPLTYRIAKSRRQGGQPYLLQRGHWVESGGKRTFTIDWEKGFDERAAAEQHLKWLDEHAKEIDSLNTEPATA